MNSTIKVRNNSESLHQFTSPREGRANGNNSFEIYLRLFHANKNLKYFDQLYSCSMQSMWLSSLISIAMEFQHLWQTTLNFVSKFKNNPTKMIASYK